MKVVEENLNVKIFKVSLSKKDYLKNIRKLMRSSNVMTVIKFLKRKEH